MIDPKTIASIVAAVTAVAGGSLAVEQRYVDEFTYVRHVAESRVGIIFDLIDRIARATDPEFHDTLCRSLEQELTNLCVDSEQHPMCVDRAMLLSKAGC